MNINPFSYFMSLKPVVKIFALFFLSALCFAFMFFAFKAGMFDDIVSAILKSVFKYAVSIEG